MNWNDTLDWGWPVFVQGMVLGLGLIVAIGAQNAFVLRQGLRREHVGSVVAFCAVADAVLITAGVFGMAQALGDRPMLARGLALGGAVFLAVYGWRALQRARRTAELVQPSAAVTVDSALREMSFGVWEGRTLAEFRQSWRESTH